MKWNNSREFPRIEVHELPDWNGTSGALYTRIEADLSQDIAL